MLLIGSGLSLILKPLQPISANLSWFSGPEGRKNLAHGVSRGYAVRGNISHGVAKDSSENLSPLRGSVDPLSIVHALTGVATVLRPSGPVNQHASDYRSVAA